MKSDKRRRVLAVCLIIVAIALLGYAAYLLFWPEKKIDVSGGGKEKIAADNSKVKEEMIKKLSGKAYSNNEDGVKTVLIFSELNKGDRYQRLITLVYRESADEPASDEQLYTISDDGKKIIYDPEASPMERDFVFADDKIIIDKTQYTKDDIKKYTD